MSLLAEKILVSFLSKGYFPKELPVTFVTQSFAKNARNIIKDWEAQKVFSKRSAKDFKSNKTFPSGKSGYKELNTEPEVLTKPKRTYERRTIHLTHPIPQSLLCFEISQDWQALQKILSRQIYSQDKIIFSEHYSRGIKDINFPLHRAKKAYVSATSDWLVKTDVSRFYPSIYTHSIAWAAYGKEKVKSDLKKYNGSFADRLDVLVRGCNRNQTIGIPIGPETSRIIAEIVSTGVDREFATLESKIPLATIDRLQDDWVIGMNSLDEAERALSHLVAAYRKYSLDINGSKTSVTHILKSSTDDWKTEISSFLSHRPGALLGTRLATFLQLSLKLQLQNPSEPVVNYVLAVIEGTRFSDDDLPELESFLLACAAISPGSMDQICRIILNIEHFTRKLSKERITLRFLDLFKKNLQKGATFECIWILHTLRGMKVNIDGRSIIDMCSDVPSSVLRILLMDISSSGKLAGKLPLDTWRDEATDERTRTDWTWLYAYEGLRRGWLSDKYGLLNKSFFLPMHSRNVFFYDPTRNVKSSKGVKKAKSVLRFKQYVEAAFAMRLLRGFESSLQFYD